MVQIVRGICWIYTQIANFMGQHGTHLGPAGAQMGPLLAPWTLLSGYIVRYAQYNHFSKLKWLQFEITSAICEGRAKQITKRNCRIYNPFYLNSETGMTINTFN